MCVKKCVDTHVHPKNIKVRVYSSDLLCTFFIHVSNKFILYVHSTQIYILLNIRQTVKKHLISDSFQAQFDILRLQYHACFVFGAIDMQ